MFNSLLWYNKNIVRHILSSQIKVLDSTKILNVVSAKLETHTINEYVDFVHLFMLLRKRATRQEFVLPKSQQKYQTMFSNKTILNIPLSQDELNILLTYILKKIIPNQTREIYDNTLIIQKQNIKFNLFAVPFFMYNKSNLFRNIFLQDINEMNLSVYYSFNQKSLPIILFYFIFSGLISPFSTESFLSDSNL